MLSRSAVLPSTTSTRRTCRGLVFPALLAACAVAVAGCSSTTGPTTSPRTETAVSEPTSSGPTSEPPATSASSATRGANSPATSKAAPDLRGKEVRVLGLWSGPEYDSFVSVKSAWEAATGATVAWERNPDLQGAIDAGVAAGTPPDIVVLPNPGLLHHLAADGRLVPLETVLDNEQIERQYSPAWRELGSHAGQLYGIASKVTSKSVVWYSPKAFATSGFEVPATWDEWRALADKMVAAGTTPFSIVAPGGPGSGWALTDLVSNVVLDSCGASRYDAWVAGTTPWTEPCIASSFAKVVDLLTADGYVLGGVDTMLSTSDSDGAYPVFADPPAASMYPMASFAQAFIAAKYPALRSGSDYSVFAFPPQRRGTGPVVVGADLIVMLNDSPVARSFLAYMAGPEAQRAWIELGGFTSVNRAIPLDAYKDAVARSIAEGLGRAEVVRFSAGDAMPWPVQQAWWSAMGALVRDPTVLTATLDQLTQAGAAAR